MATVSLWRGGSGLLPLFPDKEGPGAEWSVILLVIENHGRRNRRKMHLGPSLLSLLLTYSLSLQIFTKHDHVSGSGLSTKNSEPDLLG